MNKNKRKYKILTLSEKEELMKYYEQHGYKETAKKYRIPRATIVYWQTRIKTAKTSDAHPLARRYLIRPETIALVKELHKKYPTRTLKQISEEVTKKSQHISITRTWHIISGR